MEKSLKLFYKKSLNIKYKRNNKNKNKNKNKKNNKKNKKLIIPKFTSTPTPPPILKEKLCTNYIKYGQCIFGDKCYFAHNNDKDLNQLKLKKLCKNWINGTCKFGENCKYYHDKSVIPTKTISSSLCSNYSNYGYCKYGKQCHYKHDNNAIYTLCRNYILNGQCNYGDLCRFSHDKNKIFKHYTKIISFIPRINFMKNKSEFEKAEFLLSWSRLKNNENNEKNQNDSTNTTNQLLWFNTFKYLFEFNINDKICNNIICENIKNHKKRLNFFKMINKNGLQLTLEKLINDFDDINDGNDIKENDNLNINNDIKNNNDIDDGNDDFGDFEEDDIKKEDIKEKNKNDKYDLDEDELNMISTLKYCDINDDELKKIILECQYEAENGDNEDIEENEENEKNEKNETEIKDECNKKENDTTKIDDDYTSDNENDDHSKQTELNIAESYQKSTW